MVDPINNMRVCNYFCKSGLPEPLTDEIVQIAAFLTAVDFSAAVLLSKEQYDIIKKIIL